MEGDEITGHAEVKIVHGSSQLTHDRSIVSCDGMCDETIVAVFEDVMVDVLIRIHAYFSVVPKGSISYIMFVTMQSRTCKT